MRTQEERSKLLQAIRDGKAMDRVDLREPWDLPAPDLRETVRYCARLMPDTDADRFRSAASRSSDLRRRLVEVSEIVTSLKKMPLSEVVRLRSEDSLRGQVAGLWLDAAGDSLGWLARLGAANVRLTLEELVRKTREFPASLPVARLLVSRPALVPAAGTGLYRSGSSRAPQDVRIAASGDELTIDVRIPDMDGEDVTVTLRQQQPVLLGSGLVRNGRLTLRVPGGVSLLPELEPSQVEAIPSRLATDDSASRVPPALGEFVALARLERDVMSVTLDISDPSPLAGQTLALDLEVAPSHWQRIAELPAGGESRIELRVPMPIPADQSGTVGVTMRATVLDR